jgi:hypothetical protein
VRRKRYRVEEVAKCTTSVKQQCCAVSNCCRTTLSVRSIQYIHAVLRAGLQQAMREDDSGRRLMRRAPLSRTMFLGV